MKRPCECGLISCHLCRLYITDPEYRQLWGGVPNEDRTAPCVYLGAVLSKPVYCPVKWVRACEIHGQCTIETCKTCADYEPS